MSLKQRLALIAQFPQTLTLQDVSINVLEQLGHCLILWPCVAELWCTKSAMENSPSTSQIQTKQTILVLPSRQFCHGSWASLQALVVFTGLCLHCSPFAVFTRVRACTTRTIQNWQQATISNRPFAGKTGMRTGRRTCGGNQYCCGVPLHFSLVKFMHYACAPNGGRGPHRSAALVAVRMSNAFRMRGPYSVHWKKETQRRTLGSKQTKICGFRTKATKIHG